MKRRQKDAWKTLYEKLSVGFATLVNPPFLSCITTTMLLLSRASVLAYEAPALVPAGDTTPTIQRLGRNLSHASIQDYFLQAWVRAFLKDGGHRAESSRPHQSVHLF